MLKSHILSFGQPAAVWIRYIARLSSAQQYCATLPAPRPMLSLLPLMKKQITYIVTVRKIFPHRIKKSIVENPYCCFIRGLKTAVLKPNDILTKACLIHFNSPSENCANLLKRSIVSTSQKLREVNSSFLY